MHFVRLLLAGSKAALIASLLIATHNPSAAQNDDRPSVAVYPTIVIDQSKDVVSKLNVDIQEVTRQLEEGLRATRRFKMFERSSTVMEASVLKEQDFATNSRALGDAAEFGKLNNVGLLVQPIITGYSVQGGSRELPDFPGKYVSNHKAMLSVTVKVLDTTSGEIKFQTTQTGDFSTSSGVSDGRMGPPSKDAWNGIAKTASLKITNAIIGYIFPVLVIKVNPKDIFVNRGEGGGIAVGEAYDIFSAGEDMIDPVTKENLGSAETLLGRVKVERVNPKFSVVSIVGKLSETPKIGDILRKPSK